MLKYLDKYSEFLRNNKYSDETIYNYIRDLNNLDNYLIDQNIEFKNIDKNEIENYKKYLYSNARMTSNNMESQAVLGISSINRLLSSLRSYLKFLVEMEYPSPISLDLIKLDKIERKNYQIAELNDLIRLIESPTILEKNKITAARNRAMLEILFSTGMLISELISINRQQVDKAGKLLINRKGKLIRHVYLTPRAYKYLNEYLKFRTDSLSALFIPLRGRNSNDKSGLKKRISPNYLQERIKHYREKLKINIPISAHSLRHGFATYLAESGANPAAIQILLGHESLDTTTRYVHASDKYAEKTHHDFHPLKNA